MVQQDCDAGFFVMLAIGAEACLAWACRRYKALGTMLRLSFRETVTE